MGIELLLDEGVKLVTLVGFQLAVIRSR
jgi:hypothetical protein